MKVKTLQTLLRNHGEQVFCEDFIDRLGIKKRGVERFVENESQQASNLSFLQLAEACMGWEATSALRQGEDRRIVQELAEAAGLSYTAFPKLAGQAVQQKVIQSYNTEEFILRGLVNAEPQSFSGKGFETDIDSLSEAEEVGENQSYPWSQFGENTIAIPSSKKWGNIIGMTRETLAGDRTGEIMRQAAAVGKSIGIAVENEIGRVMLGIENTYERNGVQQDTYDTDNTDSGFVLTGWRDFDQLDQLFNVMVDPNNGEPLAMPTRDVLAAFITAFREARHLINSTQVRSTDAAGNDQSIDGNPISDLGTVVQSTRLYHLAITATPDGLGLTPAQAETLIIYGNLRSAFVRKVVWPLDTEEIRDSFWSQDKDIVAAWKASERSRTMVERRHTVIKAYNSAA
jgi:hypothetical protein